MRNRSFPAAIALAMIIPSPALPQQTTADSQKIAGIVVLEGPYELTGGVGIVGYVSNRTGTRVDFKPCTGPVLPVDVSRLKPTILNCDDDPVSKPNPFNMACSKVASQVAVLADSSGEDPKNAPVGTLFVRGPADKFTKTLPTPEGMGQWAAASQVAACGDKYIYLPNAQSSEAWIGLIKDGSE